MLRVRIDSREVEVVPVTLAQMVLDGALGRHHLTKASDGAAERPLEYALDPPHCEALAAELLRRLQALYVPEEGASYDIDALRTRVEALSQWHWREPDSRARLLWVAAAGIALLGLPILARLLRQERTPQSLSDTHSATGMEDRHWTRREALGHPLFWFVVPALLGPGAFITAFFRPGRFHCYLL